MKNIDVGRPFRHGAKRFGEIRRSLGGGGQGRRIDAMADR